MTVSTEGDGGDVCYLLGVLKHLMGSPHTLLIEDRGRGNARVMSQWCAKLLGYIGPLVRVQPYIKECRMRKPEDTVDWRSGDFRREGMHSLQHTLLRTHLNHYNHSHRTALQVDEQPPWLIVEPAEELRGMITVNRTSRYQNPSFPWKKIVAHYGDRLVFIGLPHEHMVFCESFGEIRHRKTDDILQVAQLIAGSELFIGNQSSPNAVAMGMGHPVIQEVAMEIPDCIFPRENCQYVDNGVCSLPDISGSGTLEIRPQAYRVEDIVTHTTPPGQWQVDGLPPFGVFGDLLNVCKLNKIGPQDGTLAEWIKVQNAMRVPEFFFGEVIHMHTKNSEAARRNAGFPPRSVKELIGL